MTTTRTTGETGEPERIAALREVANNAGELLSWLSAERSAINTGDYEARDIIFDEIVTIKERLSLSIHHAIEIGEQIKIGEWETRKTKTGRVLGRPMGGGAA